MDQPSPSGLKPTLRQMMIFVLWAAILTAGTRAMIRYRLLGDRPEFVCLMMPICYGFYPMPILVGLLWALDRPGRIAAWYRSAGMLAANFVGPILFLLSDLICYALTGRPTLIFPMGPAIALVGFWSGWKSWKAVWPRPCPGCGRRSVIPIAEKLRPQSKRLANSGKRNWCASCGAACEREGKEEWRAWSAENA